jgi:hypothetical protein
VEARTVDGRRLIEEKARIAVVGGGAFGVTAAAAAAYAGFETILFERQQELIHLQRGCDTRWVHPRFYDWPAPEAESRLARLPFLDWPAGTAASVAAEIESQFREIENNPDLKLKAICEVSELAISLTGNGYEIHFRARSEQNIAIADVIVYAVGFGTETGGNASYWRNDQLAQSELDFTGASRVPYVISGFGDGALVDVFRLAINDFRHERIFRELFQQADEAGSLTTALRVLQKNAPANSNLDGWLFDGFQQLEGDSRPAGQKLRQAMDHLRSRLRSDTDISLNGRAASFRQALSLTKISFSNALLVYCLFRVSAIRYVYGELDTSDPNNRKLSNGQLLPSQAKFIIRHGTDREKALRDVGFHEEKAIEFMRKQGDELDTGQQIFPPGWWGRFTSPDSKSDTLIEFVPPQLITYATTFVCTLASALKALIDKKSAEQKRFRATFHRLVRFEDVEGFQQVTEYFGRVEDTTGIRRFFPVTGGIVGLACRTGHFVVVRKTDEANFERIWELTEFKNTGAKAIKPYVDSLLACPFFAAHSADGDRYVLGVLFVDSAEADFFDDELVLDAIAASCRGFVELLEKLTQSRALRPLVDIYLGFKVQKDDETADLVGELQKLGAKFLPTEDLTFKTLTTFELEVGHSVTFPVR